MVQRHSRLETFLFSEGYRLELWLRLVLRPDGMSAAHAYMRSERRFRIYVPPHRLEVGLSRGRTQP